MAFLMVPLYKVVVIMSNLVTYLLLPIKKILPSKLTDVNKGC